jgi:deoxyribodipyrimidine photo-lyase
MAHFPSTRQAALERIQAIRPGDYARTRNDLEGAVTRLSPYITHGLVSLPEVLAAVSQQFELKPQDKLLFELGWREYDRHVWAHRGEGILASLHEGCLPESEYAAVLPADIRQASTGVPVIDTAVRTLYGTGYLHNHARMWLASYVVHIRKVHWRVAADWLYGHLLDGDLASNHLSWQWVAGTGSSKPYLFNADNVARFAPEAWHSPGSVIDQSYEILDQIARQPRSLAPQPRQPSVAAQPTTQPDLRSRPPIDWGGTEPQAQAVNGCPVWLVHPWNLGELPAQLPKGTVIVGIFLSEFHQAWPWSERRWRFVVDRMKALVHFAWYGDVAAIAAALKNAVRVGSVHDLHLQPWLASLADCEAAPALFPFVDKRCDSFSKWWTQVVRNDPGHGHQKSKPI